MSDPLDLTPIITKLKTDCAADFRVIGGAADLDAVMDGVPTAPAAYVIPAADEATPNELYGATAQRVTVAFGVVICAKNVAGRVGEAAVLDIVAARRAIRDSIFGWQPSADHTEIQIAGGQLLDFRPGVIWWQDTYRTSYEERTQ